MLNQLHLLYPKPCLLTQVAMFRNRKYLNVMSDAFSQLESQCEQVCPPSLPPQQKVTVIGAGSDVGKISSLFLKQQKLIKILALYDDKPEHRVLGVGTDLSHIDTSTRIEAYQGKIFIRQALQGADVVLICGNYSRCFEHDRAVFLKNMNIVRNSALSISQVCPGAVVAIQTPPVDATFALCAHTLMGLKTYNKRRVLGVNAVNAMRANQLYSAITNTDPAQYNIPVMGGCSRGTRVPVFSVANSCNVSEGDLFTLTRLVREADDMIFDADQTQGYLSTGFATARFVVNIMKGLFETPTYLDSAFVEQDEPAKSYGLPCCALPVTMGPEGVVEYLVPKINKSEQELLEFSMCALEDLLNLGRCYATGDDYHIHHCKYCPNRNNGTLIN